jgi:hypothetical protein
MVPFPCRACSRASLITATLTAVMHRRRRSATPQLSLRDPARTQQALQALSSRSSSFTFGSSRRHEQINELATALLSAASAALPSDLPALPPSRSLSQSPLPQGPSRGVVGRQQAPASADPPSLFPTLPALLLPKKPVPSRAASFTNQSHASLTPVSSPRGTLT